MTNPRPKGRMPDWELRYLNKDTDEKGQVGAAWTNDDGSIRIKLNPRVVLEAGPDCVLTLFVWQDNPNKKLKAQISQEELDSIPF